LCNTEAQATSCHTKLGTNTALVLEDGICRDAITYYTNPTTFAAPATTPQDLPRPTNCYDLYSALRVLTGTKTKSADDSTIFELTLNTADINAIKVSDLIGKNQGSSFISFSSDLMDDMAPRKVTEVPFTAGEKAVVFVPDTTSPRVVDTTLDLEARELTLVFDEPVRVNTISVTDITLLNDNCLVCTTGTYRHDDECIETCPDGFFPSAATSSAEGLCNKCHSTCTTCTGSSDNQCTACKPTLALSNGMCTSPCYATATFRSNKQAAYVGVTATILFANVFNDLFDDDDISKFKTSLRTLLNVRCSSLSSSQHPLATTLLDIILNVRCSSPL
jgi:hypothetical protein